MSKISSNPFSNPDDVVKAVEAIMLGKDRVAETNKNDKSDDGDGLDAVQPKAVKKKFKDRKDKDIDNDGDTDDSDEYLHKKRKAISKAVKERDEEKSVKESGDATKKKLAPHSKDEPKGVDNLKSEKKSVKSEEEPDDEEPTAEPDDDKVDPPKKKEKAAKKDVVKVNPEEPKKDNGPQEQVKPGMSMSRIMEIVRKNS